MTTSEKTCFKCVQNKPLDEFYKHPRMADGHLGKCKECAKRDVRENRIKNYEYYLAFDKNRAMLPHRVGSRKAYSKTKRGREVGRKTSKSYAERNPLKISATTAVNNALRDGRLQKHPCEVCGEEKSQAHHDDYSKPLGVRWLCTKHHREWHKHNKPLCPDKTCAIDKKQS